MALQRDVIAPKDPAVDMSPNLNLPLSPAIRAGEFIFVSGMVAIDATGVRMHGTVAAETRQIREYKSRPEGYWTWGAIGPAGLAYNPNVVPADQAPKTWEEAIDAKWTDGITVKLSTSDLQHVSWFELRGLYGPDYWKKFGELKPKGFDSYVQQFDRLVNQDKIIHTAQYAGYLEWKSKGAPVGFNSPAAGLPATPETWGIPTEGPHPNAARLFLDWYLSDLGQKAVSENLYLHLARHGAAPWDRYTGLR